jgi:hypothetical protein
MYIQKKRNRKKELDTDKISIVIISYVLSLSFSKYRPPIAKKRYILFRWILKN